MSKVKAILHRFTHLPRNDRYRVYAWNHRNYTQVISTVRMTSDDLGFLVAWVHEHKDSYDNWNIIDTQDDGKVVFTLSSRVDTIDEMNWKDN